MSSGVGNREVVARLAAQHAVARELFRAESLEDAAPGVLAAVATALGWEVGAMWEVPEGGDALRLVDLWEARPGLAAELRQASEAQTFSRGAGLPGRAWATGEVVWSPDLATDPDFPRRAAAAKAGLAGGLAVPVPVGEAAGVVAVIEFFTAKPTPPDDELRRLLVGFADQLSQFVRRRRAEQAVRHSAALSSAVVSSALDCVVTMDHQGRVEEFNPAAERTFGYSREEALGQEMAELIIPPELRDRHRQGLRRYLESGEGPILDRRIELPGMRRDGTRLSVELTVTRIAGVQPPRFTGYLRDVSGRRAAEQAQRHLAAIVESTDDAVLSKDLEGIVTSWNPGAERLYGYRAEAAVGQHISFIVPADRRGEESRVLAAISRGKRLDPYETERIRADGTRIDVSLTASPIFEEGDAVIGASVIARDITARRRAAQAQEFLAAASAALDASLDPGQTLRTIARTAVPDLAQLCVIDLLHENGTIGGAIVAASDPALVRELEDLRRRFPLHPQGRHPVAQVLRSGRSLVLRDLIQPEVIGDVAQSDEHRDFMVRAGYNSAAVVPMFARGRLLGAISLLQVHNDVRYDPSDLALLEDLAGRAGMAYDNARLYADRTRVARTLQRSLLPADLPAVPGFTVAASYQPAGEGNEVGGDFYDVFESDGDWMLIVGDVCGKGAEAAALTALIRNSVRALASVEREPSALLRQVNRVMLSHDFGGRFATAVLCRLSTGRGRPQLRAAVAGHPPPLVLSGEGVVTPVQATGDLLGIRSDAAFGQQEIALRPRDCVLLYTDGVLEAGAPAFVLRPEELETLLARCAGLPTREVVRSIEREALRLGQGSLRDDLAVLAVSVTGSR